MSNLSEEYRLAAAGLLGRLAAALRQICKRSTSFSGKLMGRRLAARQKLLERITGQACTAAARRFRILSMQS